MKTLITSLIATLFSITLFAAAPVEKPSDASAEKLVEMIENTTSSDWATYAKAAELSINWNADLALAKEWIDHAITVERNHKTLEILGDYYVRLGDEEKAFAAYMEAIEINITNTENLDRLQRKVMVYAKELKK
ncbi:hypothetical protein EI427_00830 [Flammeovirga pectinis]|uniref:Uncharacterized protein n=1 Tax=Flammeovirga pectinis TaxID=2494373 RepID=A0A3Q9FIA8_9BACT|nr:hypothetical protein [Flammeovirga pectinis]AZQ60805.1 hypothetical protein EI427_00830 [Flammeovirga pectinis]